MPCFYVNTTPGFFTFLFSVLWTEILSQCTDPLIYKLNNIQQHIANLTMEMEIFRKENKDLRNNISSITSNLENYKSQKGIYPKRMPIQCKNVTLNFGYD